MQVCQSLKAYINNLGDISDQELDQVLTHFRKIYVKKGTTLLMRRQVCRHIYFVCHGSIRMYFKTSKQDATRYIAIENNFGTALSSFITQQPSNEYIQVLEDSELREIRRDEFYLLLEKIPIWQKVYQSILEKAVQSSFFRLETFLTLKAKERFEWLLENHPDFLNRFSVSLLSSYLGLSRETLSRMKSKAILK